MNECIFCKISNNEVPSWKVFENEKVLAFFDYNPASEYHTLVIPKNHYRDIFDIPEEELHEIMNAIKHITKIYKEKLGIQNIQIINSSGEEAQQEVFHIHFHIVPRQTGDNQDIKWQTQIKIRENFAELLKKIN